MVQVNIDNLPVITTERLRNKLRVVVVEMEHLHSVEVSMFIRMGSRQETEDNNGISHFLEHMMFRGCKAYKTSYRLNEAFETIGSELTASTGGEHTVYNFSPHFSYVKEGLKLFANFLKTPLFQKIDVEREIVLEELLQEQNDDGQVIDKDNIACSLLWPNSSMRFSTIGSRENILGFSERDLRRRMQDYYTPESMVLCVSGRVNTEDVLKCARRNFSNYGLSRVRHQVRRFKPLPKKQNKKQSAFVMCNSSQCELQVCVRALSAKHRDMATLQLIQRILDDGISSRLQRQIRDRQGLAYEVSCSVNGFSDSGTFDIDIVVSKSKVVRAVTAILKELKKLTEKPIARNELIKVKRRFNMSLESELDSPQSMSYRYGWYELFNTVRPIEKEIAFIESLATEEIQATAKRIFCPSNIYVVCVGGHESGSPVQHQVEALIKNF